MYSVASMPNYAPKPVGSGFWFASHKTPEWSTPPEFFDELNKKYHFVLDVASTHENCKCEKHYTMEEDGLKQDWDADATDEEGNLGAIWCFPPYGLG
jgi:site-specific DNA-methyltransferase (adenine-specific)